MKVSQSEAETQKSQLKTNVGEIRCKEATEGEDSAESRQRKNATKNESRQARGL